ncbi:MAG: adenylate/guanylate cyclase domain-containing protein [Pseudomonadota bacterium]
MPEPISVKLKGKLANQLKQRIATRRKAITKGLSRHRARQALWGLVIGLVAAAMFLTLRGVGALESLELKTFDWRMKALRLAVQGSGENVALLYVDEPSLVTMKEMGISWPWPRELYAGALDFAKRGGAKAVVFDLFFSEDSSYGLGDDESFAKGIRQGPPAYFVIFASKHETADYPPIINDVLERSRVPFEGEPPSFVQSARSLQSLPVPEIADTATGFGNAETKPDVDGIYRRVPLAIKHQGKMIPQIGFKVVSDLEKLASIKWSKPTLIMLDDMKVPLDDKGNMIINYIGGVDSYPAYPLAKILLSNQQIKDGKKPDLDPSVLKDRIAIVGVAAPGLYDLKPMPLARVYPGPEIHATVIDSLLRRDFITPVGGKATTLIVFALALATSLGLSQMFRFSHIVVWIMGIAGIYVVITGVLFYKNILMPMVAPLGAIALSSFTMILKSYLAEGRKKSAIKKAFGQYLSPAVVSEIAQNPDEVRMGGEEQEVTVFFSDIADFTTISESTTPTDLVSQLCKYLTGITEIITGREGTLDKYIGDAVMAFWGAPLKIADHAAQATLAALQIQDVLSEFPQFKTRIGIHTGRAVIGNIGSDLRFNYTAIGDTVNLASRLEGLNKCFGTRIILSETTFNEAKDLVEARLIGRVRVKGRMEPISIYQPLCEKGKLGQEAANKKQGFDKAMQSFISADFAAAKAAFGGIAQGDDSVVAYYLAMCDRYAIKPPPQGFDGVITFTEK